jgi:hypothetical protein
VEKVTPQLHRYARWASIVLEIERHSWAHAFLPLTRTLFRWSSLTVHDGCASVAATFRADELATLARAAGADSLRVRRHRPWFRVSLVVPAINEEEIL